VELQGGLARLGGASRKLRPYRACTQSTPGVMCDSTEVSTCTPVSEGHLAVLADGVELRGQGGLLQVLLHVLHQPLCGELLLT